jgi:hypothetical protein
VRYTASFEECETLADRAVGRLTDENRCHAMSTGRRRLLLSTIVAIVVAVVLAVVVWLLQPPTAITRENAAKIKEGMAMDEVEAILGGAARDETTGPVIREEPPEFAPRDASGRSFRITILDQRPHLEWHSDEVRIWVHFDSNGNVTECTYFPTHRAEESLLDKLRRWLRL